jgi:XTP/dITP diphosphohydrolase
MILGKGTTLVVASHNPGKVREIKDLLAPFGIETKGASELGLAEPDETGTSFAANAELKARAAADASGLPALADDSARWAGPGKDFSVAMARIARELDEMHARDRTAKFVCALALAQPGGACDVFEGEVHGTLTFPPRGEKGFGYDPIFVANGMRETFAEIAPAQKHAMSHRAKAFAKLIEALKIGS